MYYHIYYPVLVDIGITQNIEWLFHGHYSAVPFKGIVLKIGYQTKLNHRIIAYDNIIAYACSTLIFINLKVVCNDISSR